MHWTHWSTKANMLGRHTFRAGVWVRSAFYRKNTIASKTKVISKRVRDKWNFNNFDLVCAERWRDGWECMAGLEWWCGAHVIVVWTICVTASCVRTTYTVSVAYACVLHLRPFIRIDVAMQWDLVHLMYATRVIYTAMRDRLQISLNCCSWMSLALTHCSTTVLHGLGHPNIDTFRTNKIMICKIEEDGTHTTSSGRQFSGFQN